MISEVLAFFPPIKAKSKRQELRSFLAYTFSSSRAGCKERREGGSNVVVPLGILSMVGSDKLGWQIMSEWRRFS